MYERNSQDYDNLLELLRQPTAPFREQAVRDAVAARLAASGVPWFEDADGNLVIGHADPSAWRRRLERRQREPVRLFIAHMDHPGFHGMRWQSRDRLEVRWHGGSPTRHLRGAEVWLAISGRECGAGTLVGASVASHGHGLERAVIRIRELATGRRPAARRLYGGFRFRAAAWRRGTRLHARVLDDLVGVHAVVETACTLWEGHHAGRRHFTGLLTRAEEVGFVGAVAHLRRMHTSLRRGNVVCISLEASRTLPGADVGRGVVIRLGDRRTLFDTRATRVLEQVADACLERPAQRRVMDGGSCEATAAAAWGLPVVGLTLPLGNYHNQCLDGGEGCVHRGGVAPEYIDLRDLADYRRLCLGLMTPGLPWSDPWQDVRDRLTANLERYRRLLEVER